MLKSVLVNTRAFLLAIVALTALSFSANAQTPLGGYSAFIGTEDLYNSSGTRLKDAVQILRQDRANVHRFGIVHPNDEKDPWFFQPEARAAMEGMFRNGGGIPASIQRAILQGNVPVYVTIYTEDGNFVALTVDIPG